MTSNTFYTLAVFAIVLLIITKPIGLWLTRERQKFCVHGIIGARQTGASNEHEHQTQFS